MIKKCLVLGLFAVASFGCDKGNPNAPTAQVLPGGAPAVPVMYVLKYQGRNETYVEICGLVLNGLERQPKVLPNAPNGSMQNETISRLQIDDYSCGHKSSKTIGFQNTIGTMGECTGHAATVFQTFPGCGVDWGIVVHTNVNETIEHTLDPIRMYPSGLRASGRRIRGDFSMLPTR